jgi:hypothetical protein
MGIVIYTFLLLGCSGVLSVVTFLVGRCGRRLPIDGALPRIVQSARFDSADDSSGACSGRTDTQWPPAF